MCKRYLLLICLVFTAAISSNTLAADITWNGDGDGSSWDEADNWDTDSVPSADTNDYAILNSGASATIDSTMTADCNVVSIGHNSASATLSVTGGSLDVTDRIFIGNDSNGVGTLTISGGSVHADSFINVSFNADSNGTLNVTGGSLSSDRGLIVGGDGGIGLLQMTGGEIDLATNIWIAYDSNSVGDANISGGAISADSMFVGTFGPGSLQITKGNIDLATDLWIAYDSGTVGDVNLYGGTITADRLLMYASRSDMDITDGVLYLTGDDRVTVKGYVDNSYITSSKTGGSIVYKYYPESDETKVYAVGTATTVSFNNAGSGTLWSTVDNWDLDRTPTYVDDVNIDGSYTCTIDSNMAGSRGADCKALYVGKNSGSSVLNITGGRLTTTDHIRLGLYSGSNGTITISDGILESGDRILAGVYDTGTFNVSGGYVSTVSHLNIAYGSGSTGTVNITGGTIESGDGVVVGSGGGTAVLHMTDGLIDAPGHFYIAYGTGTTADVNLHGGVIRASSLQMYKNRGTLDITYGVLILDGNDTSTVNGYISDSDITIEAFGGTDTVKVQYDSGTNKTYVWADDTGLTQIWDGSSDNSWNTQTNWDNNRCPFALDVARINSTTGATTIDTDVECDNLEGPGYSAGTTGTLTINDGDIQVYDEMWVARFGTGTVNVYHPATLTIYDRFTIATDINTVCTLNMYGGTIDATDNSVGFYCAWKGDATINMYGGTINLDEFYAPAHADGTANVNLHGGVINCSSISILTGSKIDLSESGRLVVDGNVVSTINTYLSYDKITADGSTTDSLVLVDYGNINSGKTTVQVKDVNTLSYFLQTEDTNDTWTFNGFDTRSSTDPDGYGGATFYRYHKGSSPSAFEVYRVDSNDIQLRYEVIKGQWIRRFDPTSNPNKGHGYSYMKRTMTAGGQYYGYEMSSFDYDLSDYNITDANYVINTSESATNTNGYRTINWAEVSFDLGSNADFTCTDVLRNTSEVSSLGYYYEDLDYKKGHGLLNWRWVDLVDWIKDKPYDEPNDIYYCGSGDIRYCRFESYGDASTPPVIYLYDIVLGEDIRQLEVLKWDSHWRAGGLEWHVVTHDKSKEQPLQKKTETINGDYNLPLSDYQDTINDLPEYYTTN